VMADAGEEVFEEVAAAAFDEEHAAEGGDPGSEEIPQIPF
jgi:hypothetical protein